MENNKLTILIDANWLLISRASVLMSSFKKDLPELARQQAQQDLEDLLAKSICVVLSKLPMIDNVVMVADGGSWRKQIPIPEYLGNTTYKGNRIKDEETDWNKIYEALNNVLKRAKKEGITVSQYNNIEGDDWIWYWSRRLNSQGVNCVIWSSDNDLKQLIQIDNVTSSFTVWYNDKNGLWMPDSIKESDNVMDFFMSMEYRSQSLELLKNKITSHNYINPNTIITSKIVCGDAGDNIQPIIKYQKGSRTYRITEKDWDRVSKGADYRDIYKFINSHSIVLDNIFEDNKYTKLINTAVLDVDRHVLDKLLDYNTKLVWLHESVIPDTIIQFMNQQEYNLYDIAYIKSNYKVLAPPRDDIRDLFESI